MENKTMLLDLVQQRKDAPEAEACSGTQLFSVASLLPVIQAAPDTVALLGDFSAAFMHTRAGDE